MATPAQAVEALNEALEILENTLEPLLENALSETMESHDRLDQAKLAAMIPYVINQLIITYLRTKGIDPTQHPVDAEVGRIKDYFYKIAKTESPTNPVQRQSDQNLQLDKAAADRFIKAALAEAARADKSQPPSSNAVGLSAPLREPKKIHSDKADDQPSSTSNRFSRMNDHETDDDSSSESVHAEESEPRVIQPDANEKKRKRPTMDPFTGYMEPAGKKAKAKARSKQRATLEQDAPSNETQNEEEDKMPHIPTNQDLVEDTGKPKKARKKSKKNKQSAE